MVNSKGGNIHVHGYLDIQRMKAEITMEDILRYYGIRAQLRAVNSHHLTGCCPIHHGDNLNAFHVDLKQNLFNCFTHCGGGSIFDFVMKMEQLDFYSAARKIWGIFCLSEKQQQQQQQKQKQQQQQQQQMINFLYCTKKPRPCPYPYPYPTDNLLARPGVPILRLQPNHPYLRKRHISPSLAMSFHMGYCKHGIMKDRIAIPIMDTEQHIVAYAGRAIHDDDERSPRYLFPKNFKKSEHLFNVQHLHHFQNINYESNKPVFLVEGFFACIHIVNAGFDAIALMGTAVSPHQLDMMKETRRFFIVMMDGDEAGRNATPIIEKKLTGFQIPFRTIKLMDGKQPDELNYDYLKSIVKEQNLKRTL
jgi:DNA primase